MNFSFHPDAEAEFLEAIDYFEEVEGGLGLQFSREVFSTVDRIIEYPSGWSPFTSQTRRCLCKRFRYGIIYKVTNDELRVFAVMHLSREPDYWHSRLSN
ncbi:MAG TPA: type II toxin-antitoxin system RelE/ParE family toxin [Pyrinomonadaceae bacterium]|nr:type II toxin-antitoxin system RelE/ParE family toxin [Pyrinomonadaceae bacterium]